MVAESEAVVLCWKMVGGDFLPRERGFKHLWGFLFTSGKEHESDRWFGAASAAPYYQNEKLLIYVPSMTCGDELWVTSWIQTADRSFLVGRLDPSGGSSEYSLLLI